MGVLPSLLVEAEDRPSSRGQDGSPDQIGLLHHQVDRFLLRLRQRPGLEDRAALAHEIQEVLLVHVPLEKRPIGRILVDVSFFDVHPLLLQKTSGVAAGRSSRFPEEGRLGHNAILPSSRPVAARDAAVQLKDGAHDQRDLPLDPGRVDPCRAPVRVRPPDGLRPPLFVVRHALRLSPRDTRCRSTMSSRSVRTYDCPVVEITGGEPLLQKNVYPLMQRLLDEG